MRRALALVLLLAACGSDATSEDDAVATTPIAYRITYETTTGDATTTEDRAVLRPFLSRVETGGATRVTDVGLLATASSGAPWVRIEVPIAPAGGDLRPDAVLAAALDAGIVAERGSRRSLGRSCRGIELGGPVSSGTLTPIGAVAGESAEACIDDIGLVLAETWTVDGEVVLAREAVDVEVGDVASDAFSVPARAESLAFAQGGGSVRRVADDEDPGFAERCHLRAPAGFEHEGRYLVLPPALGATVDPSMPRRAEVALMTDVWTDGMDVVLLDQGAARGGASAPWDARPYTEEVDLGDAGSGVVVFDLRLNEVRVERPDGGFVRVAGTLPPDRLVAIARTLELEEAR